jgi:pantetheine-phosphate adenylyltransferase
MYPVTAMGGTFDHLHAGHKILLSMSAWITSEKLIVGMTGMPIILQHAIFFSFSQRCLDDSLLRNKVNRHVMENFTQRSKRVRAFLEFFKPSLVYDIVPINDVYGPTGWDPNIQALVVSRETLGGAAESTSV